MTLSLPFSTAAICFIVCHGGPADHFATFAKDLATKGYEVHIYASGPAVKKFQDRNVEQAIPFILDPNSEEKVAVEIAKKCANMAIVITDVGHIFDLTLQKALADHAPASSRFAYYDNPESYVPGGYTHSASKALKRTELKAPAIELFFLG